MVFISLDFNVTDKIFQIQPILEKEIGPQWEEHRLRVFESRVLKGIFGPKMEELIRGSRIFIPYTLRQI
jgi:hypothetical protein